MTSSPTVAPEWFSNLIGEGLATLYLLNLEGCPANDSTRAVGGVWSKLLWEKYRHTWHAGADTGRIRAAFASLAGSSTRWPSPAKFWEHLPERQVPGGTKVIGPGWGREREGEAKQAAIAWAKDLGIDPSMFQGMRS